MRDHPALLWLLLAVVVALVHPFVPEAEWLMVHLVLLGAMTHAVMVWSTHFSHAVLRSAPGPNDRREQSRRLGLLMVGTTCVIFGVPTGVWPVTVVGASVVVTAVLWHGWGLWRRLRQALPSRFAVTVRYYVAAALCVPVGATFGVLLARGPSEEWHGRLIVAHSLVLVLGWLGLTVTGTLLTLWPTMLRTRIDDRAERRSRHLLPGFIVALAVIVAGALSGRIEVAAVGIVGYVVALLVWGSVLVGPARRDPPRDFAPLSVSVALVWLVAGLAWVVVSLVRSGGWAAIGIGYGPAAGMFAAGFAAQLLSGALSHLVPVVIGGGPRVVRLGQASFNRAATLRLVVINGGILLTLLPAPSTVKVTSSVLALLGLASFLPIMILAIRTMIVAKRNPSDADAPLHASGPALAGGAVAGVLALAVAVIAGVSVDPVAAGLPSLEARAPSVAVAPTGETTEVTIVAQGMKFAPNRIEVPAGDRLVIEVVNEDDATVHDLVMASGDRTPRLDPGESATLDLGVIGSSTEGWCSVVGHRMRGMTLDVVVTGGSDLVEAGGESAEGTDHGDHSMHDTGEASAGLSPSLLMEEGAESPAHEAELSDLGPDEGPTTHRVTLRAQEVTLEVAPGIWQRRWTFGGTAPGPTLHGRVGDTFIVTLINDGSMGHSIDFHAGIRAPDAVMYTIPPGEKLTYRFTADRAGIWMYHCSTMPMTAHIAAGMFGAVVIEPRDLPQVDRSFVLVQSEAYLDLAHGTDRESAAEVDAPKVMVGQPDAFAFNGRAFQYVEEPLVARSGERVRFWLLNAGPNRSSSFHVVGGQFDTVWFEGGYHLFDGRGPVGDATDGGSQALALAPAQGGFVELSLDESGKYPFVSHSMADAERGATGILRIRP